MRVRIRAAPRVKSAAQPLLDLGARWSESPAALAACVPVLLTALPAPRHVRAVMEEEGGGLAALKPGARPRAGGGLPLPP